MRITPLDVRDHPFRRRVSGYDREEVDTFLRAVADDYEAALRETQKLRQRVAELQGRVDVLASNEDVLKETLTTAQRLSEDLKSTAVKEAEVLLSEAEIKAEKILDAAHRRAARLAEDIREMKTLRTRLASSVRGTIETHLSLLEGLADDGRAEGPEAKVTYLPRAAADPGSSGREG